MTEHRDFPTVFKLVSGAPFESIRPNKKKAVFKVARPYLNLLEKPIIFQVFWKKIQFYAF